MATKQSDETTADGEELDVVEAVSPEEARAAFERAAQHYLGVSGAEFLRAWDAGEYGPDPDTRPGVMELALLLPWAR